MRDYKNPKMYEPIDDEEAELMKELENSEWASLPQSAFLQKKLDHEKTARQTLKKTERATIRLSKADLDGLKLLAAKEGVGYQTFISSILHKTVTGQLNV